VPDHSAIVRLAPSRKQAAADVLMRAFFADAGYEYVFPDLAERQRSLRRLWPALLGYGLLYGEVYTTPDLSGIACWIPPGNTDLNHREPDGAQTAVVAPSSATWPGTGLAPRPVPSLSH
jgi:hypothetical protein